MTEQITEKNSNILDLAGYRSRKLDLYTSQIPLTPPAPIGISQKEIGTHIENIKKSIQRINKLMAELRTIANKPNL